MNELCTDRLHLHPLQPQDAELLRAHWGDPAVRRWLWDDEAPDSARVQAIIDSSQADFERAGWGLWSLRGQGWLLGVAGLRQVPDHPQHVELVCSIQPAWWGQGMASEAAVAVLRRGFEQGLEHIVVGTTQDDDARGRSFVEHLGFAGVLDIQQPVALVHYWGLTAHTFEDRHPLRWQLRAFESLSAEDLYATLALRQRVFVVEQDCVYLDADGLDAQALHLLGWDAQGDLQAYLRVFAPGVQAPQIVIGRVLVSLPKRGQGVGARLMEQGMARAWRTWGHGPIKVSAQAHLQGWYEALGFVVSGEGYLEDGIPHLPMRHPG